MLHGAVLSDRNTDRSHQPYKAPPSNASSNSALEQLQQRLQDLQLQRQMLKNPELANRTENARGMKARPHSAVQPAARRVAPLGRPRGPSGAYATGSEPHQQQVADSGLGGLGNLGGARPATAAAKPSSRLGRGSFGTAAGAVPPLFAVSSTPRLDIRSDGSSTSSSTIEAERERTARTHLLRKLIREGYTRLGLPVPTMTQSTALEPLLYRQEKILGKGAFGLVSLARSVVTGELVAMKTIDRAKLHSENLKKAVEHEIRILKRLKHRHIVRLYEVFETPRSIHIIMEYVDGGTLQQLVKKQKRVGEADAARLFSQLIDAVSQCHAAHVCHRDLKLENFMLARGGRTLKLIDFGLSVVWKQGQSLFKSYGTPCYMAPEIIKGNNYSGSHVDVWSLGVALATMLTGTLPFQGAGDTELKKRILRGQFPCPEHVSLEARDLMAKMLALNPSDRIDAESIKAHPWLRGAAEANAEASAGQPPMLPTVENNAPLDDAVLAQLEKVGLDPADVERSVRSSAFNHAAACYDMLLTAAHAERSERGARCES